MFYLACTRFNNTTYNENKLYRLQHNEAVIYGPAYKIRDIYPSGSLMFVIEMNNEKNKIEGIGLIKNSLVSDKRYKVYDNGEYNRYIYRGNYWVSREQLISLEPEIIEICDNILFKGKSHMKFRSGITIITEKLFTHWVYDLNVLKKKIKDIFLYIFKHNSEIEKDIDEKVVEEKEVEEIFEIIPKKRKRSNIL